MKLSLKLSATVTPFLLMACGGVEPSGLEAETSEELALMARDYAGFETDDEAVAFDQTDEFRRRDILDSDRPADREPDADRPRLRDLAANFSVSIVWGNRHPDREDRAHRTHWTGGILSTAADIRGVSALGLEEGDRVVHTDAGAIRLDTVTGAGLDGVAFHLLATREDSDGVLVIDTNNFQMRIPIRELVNFRQVFRTDSGDMVGVSAFLVRKADRPDDASCMRAHVRGHWTATERGIAHFRGLVYTPDGRLGHVFGRAAEGRFGGKLVDASSGEFIALMHGVYGDGELKGRLRGREEAGFIRGSYGHSDRREGGWFAGSVVLCAADRLEPASDLSDVEDRPLPEDRTRDTATTDAATTDGATTDGASTDAATTDAASRTDG